MGTNASQDSVLRHQVLAFYGGTSSLLYNHRQLPPASVYPPGERKQATLQHSLLNDPYQSTL